SGSASTTPAGSTFCQCRLSLFHCNVRPFALVYQFFHERFVKTYPAAMQARTTATSTAARCRWHPQQQSFHTHQAPLNINNIRRRKPPRRRSSGSAFSTSLSLLLLLAVCCWCGREAAAAAAAAAPGSPLTLRVRMPDGAVKRV
ncbi:unnamed protein product, partial [Ectocarpus sp. 13 AM-2016]